MKKLRIITILIILLGSMITYVPRASAGLIIKLPSSLGLNTGLVGHWTFDGNDTFPNITYDKSGQGNHGTISGAAKAKGKLGQGLSFDGVDDYINSGSADSLDNLNVSGMTISAWINPRSIGELSMGHIVSKHDRSSGSHGWIFITTTNNRLRFYAEYGIDDTGDLQLITNNNSFLLNTWNHVMVTWDGSTDANNTHIYVNGAETAYITRTSASGTYASDAADNLKIGDDGNLSRHFDGLIDDVRIYNRALSPAEIKRLYNMGGTLKIGKTDTSTLNTGLVGHWTFDGPDMNWINGQVYDKSGNNNTGSFSGGLATTTSPIAGKLGQGMSFDGMDDYVSILHNAILSPTNVTVSGWAKPGFVGAQKYIVTKINQYTLRTTSTTRFEGAIWGCNVVGTTVYSANNWYYITFAYSSSANSGQLYVNGVAEGTACSGDNRDYTQPLEIGRRSDGGAGSYFDGLIDDVRVYNRALSPAEIKRLYNMGGTLKVGKTPSSASGGSGVTTGLVGHWTFDGPDVYENGVKAADKSGQGNNGAISGAVPTKGKLGQGMKFDGADDYVDLGESQWDGSWLNRTITAWIYWKGTQSNRRYVIVAKGTGVSVNLAFFIRTLINGDDHLSFFLGNSLLSTTANRFSSNRGWRFVAVSIDSSNAYLYIDGDAEGSGAVVDQADSNYIMTIGTGDNSSASPGVQPVNLFNGLIDDVRIYNRALSPEEVKRLYNMGR